MYNSRIHHRRSLRLKDYDYRWSGAYFVTICTQDKVCLFGHVVDGTMRLNAYGHIVADEWEQTAIVRPNVMLDAFVVMPNHVHGIICIVDVLGDPGRDTPPVCPYDAAIHPNAMPNPHHGRAFSHSVAGSLSSMMRQYKSIVTKRINRLRDMPGAAVWQPRFYEHIIRHQRALDNIRRYIDRNPERWHQDQYRSGQQAR